MNLKTKKPDDICETHGIEIYAASLALIALISKHLK